MINYDTLKIANVNCGRFLNAYISASMLSLHLNTDCNERCKLVFFLFFSPVATYLGHIRSTCKTVGGKSKINSSWWLEELVFEKWAREEHHLRIILKHLVFLTFKRMHRLATGRCRARNNICIHCSFSSLYCELKPDTCWDFALVLLMLDSCM